MKLLAADSLVQSAMTRSESVHLVMRRPPTLGDRPDGVVGAFNWLSVRQGGVRRTSRVNDAQPNRRCRKAATSVERKAMEAFLVQTGEWSHEAPSVHAH